MRKGEETNYVIYKRPCGNVGVFGYILDNKKK